MQTQIACLVDGNYVLSPNLSGGSAPNSVVATLSKSQGPDGSVTGVLSWSGAARAFLTYDMTGTRVLSYTMADYSQSAYLSVENILRVM